MLSFILKQFSGRHYKKFLEKCRPIVARINELEQSYQALSEEQLRAKTDEFRARIAEMSGSGEPISGKVFREFLVRDAERTRALVNTIGLKLDD